MDERENGKRKLRLIESEPHSVRSVGSMQIFVTSGDALPESVEAVVSEEDTFLVLSADPEFVETQENPILVILEAFETPPSKPGSVIVQAGDPLRLLAVVHDLNQDPSWKEEWVARALERVFEEAENRNLQSIALPCLGTLHGKLDKKRFIALLFEVLKNKMPSYPKKIWLVAPEGATIEIEEMLNTELRK